MPDLWRLERLPGKPPDVPARTAALWRSVYRLSNLLSRLADVSPSHSVLLRFIADMIVTEASRITGLSADSALAFADQLVGEVPVAKAVDVAIDLYRDLKPVMPVLKAVESNMRMVFADIRRIPGIIAEKTT